MTEGFRVSKKLTLPRDSVAWVISFLAKRGAGKTYNAAVLAEEMLKALIPVIVIDGMGIWWGLRVGRDGHGPGLPIVIFGGRHADIQLDSGKVAEMAEAIARTHISAVLDISQFRKGQALQIVTTFVEEIYRLAELYPAERCLFAEEVDSWAPQKPGKEQLRCLGAFEDLVRRGGNRNLGFVAITQRSAVYNKDLLTQSECLVMGRTVAPQDKKAVEEWVKERTDEDPRKLDEWFDSLKRLKNGEVYMWNPEVSGLENVRVQFRERETFHATRKFILSAAAQKIELMDVGEFIDKYKGVFEPKPPKEIKQLGMQQISAVADSRLSPSEARVVTPTQTTRIVNLAPPKLEEPLLPPPLLKAQNDLVHQEAAKIQQSYPTLVIERQVANLVIPMQLQQPTTALGRLAVALARSSPPGGRDNKWTKKAIIDRVKERAWPEDGVNEAIDQFLRWEIFEPLSGYLTFHRERIQVVDVPVEVHPE